MSIYCKHDSLVVKWAGKNWKISTFEVPTGGQVKPEDYHYFDSQFTCNLKDKVIEQFTTAENCAKALLDRKRAYKGQGPNKHLGEDLRGIRIEEYKESIFNEFGEVAP